MNRTIQKPKVTIPATINPMARELKIVAVFLWSSRWESNRLYPYIAGGKSGLLTIAIYRILTTMAKITPGYRQSQLGHTPKKVVTIAKTMARMRMSGLGGGGGWGATTDSGAGAGWPKTTVVCAKINVKYCS